jgi:hypothetical protein
VAAAVAVAVVDAVAAAVAAALSAAVAAAVADAVAAAVAAAAVPCNLHGCALAYPSVPKGCWHPQRCPGWQLRRRVVLCAVQLSVVALLKLALLLHLLGCGPTAA